MFCWKALKRSQVKVNRVKFVFDECMCPGRVVAELLNTEY